MNKIITITVSCLWIFGVFCSQAQAHFPWINVDDYSPEVGSSPHITIGWGHHYPLGGFLKKDDLKSFIIIDPDGKKEPISSRSELEFQPENSFSNPGVYLVAAQRKTGFYTKTTQGGKRQSKEGLNNIIKCSRSQMNMKSIINVGRGDGKIDGKVGHSLEIVPLANPADLRVGDYLPVQVFLNGKPYSDKLFATYMGFSTEKDVFAYATKTDHQGKGEIRILQPGIWLLKIEHEQPYPDQAVCDVESFVATLTLEVQ